MIALLLAASVALAAPADDYAAGVDAARSGDQAAAVQHFAQVIDAGGRSADAYHGLGNALYRQGNTAHALAAWRRGQLLAPRNPDLAANIERARAGSTDQLEPPAPAGASLPWGSVLSLAESAWLAGLFGFLSGVGLLVRRWGRDRGWRAVGPESIAGLGAAAVLTVTTAVAAQAPGAAVVVVPEVTARSALGPAGIDLFALHSRAEVRVVEQASDHALVQLPDGRKGWLPAAAVVSTQPGAAFPLP